MTWTISTFYDTFINKSESERFTALKMLTVQPLDDDELAVLVNKLDKALREDFTAAREMYEQDEALGWTRTWLAAIIGQFAVPDSDPGRYIRAQLTVPCTAEPNEWVRYWALVGIVRRHREATDDHDREELRADLLALARAIIAQAAQIYDPDCPSEENSHQLLKLAQAILACWGTETERTQQVGTLAASLTNPDATEGDRWSTLRALRYVPLDSNAIVTPIVELFDKPEFGTVMFEAVVALGALPAGARQAARAAECLEDFIRTTPIFAKWDAMRSRAIIGLGQLRVEDSEKVLVDQIKADNPGLVRDAAEALTNIWDIGGATERIFRAYQKDVTGLDNYVQALRWMGRDARKTIVDYLSGVTNSNIEQDRQMATTLLIELGGSEAHQRLKMQHDTVQRHLDILESAQTSVQKQYDKLVAGVRTGFSVALVMDIIVFAVGIFLIASGAYAVFTVDDLTERVLFGAGGTILGLLGLLFSQLLLNPRVLVIETINHQNVIGSVFQGYLRQMSAVDQAFTRALFDDGITQAELHAYLEDLDAIIDNAVGHFMSDSEQRRSFLGTLRPRSTIAPAPQRAPEDTPTSGDQS